MVTGFFNENIKPNIKVYLYSLAGYLVMTAIVFIFPIEFSEFRVSDTFVQFWYLVTESGSFTGGLIIYLLLMSYLVIYFKRSSKKNSGLILFFSILFFTFVFSTGLNEFYMKELIKKPRPNQVYLIEKGFIEIDSKTFFQMPGYEKKEYLENRFSSIGKIPENIFPPVFNNWITEAGFSMPSGHALISYFFGTVIFYVLSGTLKKKNRYLIYIPLNWSLLVALSRVVTGMHYNTDVAAGGFIGMFLGFIIISLPVTGKIFKNKNISN